MLLRESLFYYTAYSSDSDTTYLLSNKDKYSEPQMSVLFKYITKETDNTNKIQNEN